jgi:hypothetical protein
VGEVFVDYCGATVPVVDTGTGEVREAQVFVAVWGASSYTYAEATWSQGLADWIGSHVRAFEFGGGLTELVIPDNLRSGVTRACRYEPELNPTYQDLAVHYGVAVMPARVRKPRDKAKVESGVQLVQRWILARLRHRQFFSLAEVNQAIRAHAAGTSGVCGVDARAAGRRELVPHLLSRCAGCPEGGGAGLQALMREVGHPDPVVAASEGTEAPELWRQLEPLGFRAQLEAVEGEPRYQSWGLCRLLLRRSEEAVASSPEGAARLAGLAVRISGHLGEAYDPDWVHDLRSLALARLGDARRALGELGSARDACEGARAAGTGSPAVEAEGSTAKGGDTDADRARRPVMAGGVTGVRWRSGAGGARASWR